MAFGILTGGIEGVSFGSSDALTDPSFAWLCGNGVTSTPKCSGITLDRSAGTLTFVNAVLSEDEGKAPPITLNGTVTFPPF